VLNALKTDLMLYMDNAVQIKDAQLKKWRYSRPLVIYPEYCMVAEYTPTLIFAGDAFGEGRVEGATRSGLEAGKRMIELLSKS
jgi:predicted NAD/FAD-dependent oxidoreductase